MIGVFCSLDLFVFYLFFEAGLIPMFLIIGIWGGPKRVYSAFKFFLYTLFGSVLMLVAIISIYWIAGTTDIVQLYEFIFIKTSKKIGLFLWKIIDVKIIDTFGPDGLALLIKKISIKANKFQSGYIYQYAFVMLLGFSALLTFLIIK